MMLVRPATYIGAVYPNSRLQAKKAVL